MDTVKKRPTGDTARQVSTDEVNGLQKIAVAGAPGFEPGITIPKTDALPLGHAPTLPRIGK